MKVTREGVAQELRELRKRHGISTSRVAGSQQIMQAFSASRKDGGHASPEEAKEVILAFIDQGIADSLSAQALRNALGGTKDSARTLTERRQSFADKQGRHPDTVENWENAAIDTLAQIISGPLLSSSGRTSRMVGYPPLEVFAEVTGKNTRRITVRGLLGVPPEQVIEARVNRVTAPSLPLFIYQLQEGMQPPELLMVAIFIGVAPPSIWATKGRSLYDIMFSTQRQPLQLDQYQRAHIAFGSPDADQYYAICWSWDLGED